MDAIRRALGEVRRNHRSLNWWRNRVFVPYVLGTLSRLHPNYPDYDEAVQVTEEEWDNLVVLDGCRADAFERVADLDRFEDYRSVVSPGSHSSEWTRRTFAGESFGDIVYVSANPHTSKLAGDSFHEVIEMWDLAFDEAAGTVRPSSMAEAAIQAQNEYPDKRLVVHFMQPHGPFLEVDVPDEELDDRYWEAYDQNLANVLEVVHRMLEDLPGRTAITADHGQIAPGPVKDLLGVSGHKPGLRHPGLVEVPWATVEGERRTVVAGATGETAAEGVDDRLRDLGYKV